MTTIHGIPWRRILKLLCQLSITSVLFFSLQPEGIISAQPVFQQPASRPTPVLSAPQQPGAGAAGCQWTYYPVSGLKLQPEVSLFNDPDNTPIANLKVGSMFKGKATPLAATGSADFDGDNKTDVFRTIPRPDTNAQWQYSSGGAAAWQNLAFGLSNLNLQFGEFSKDAKTDLFTSLYNVSLPGYQWMYSPGGVNSFVNLNSDANSTSRLALGDFTGDSQTDVFNAYPSASTYQWTYSSAGTGPTINLAHSAVDPNVLRFGDFDGDGKTDVFNTNEQSGGYTWDFSSAGTSSFTTLDISDVPATELKFGDFNGDGKTDVLTTLPQGDGGLRVVLYPGGTGPSVNLGSIPAPAPALRVGDFNGDGVSDLLALRCGMRGPLAFTPVQTLAQTGYSTFHTSLAGDVNGDGQPDVILVSNCQNANSGGYCASHHLQVGAALGTPVHYNTLVAPRQLGADALDFQYAKFLTGDFDGDGKTDLAVVIPGGNTLTIMIALSNGDGTFTMLTPQTFGGETWGIFNSLVGDFNGDGKADLAFNTVCSFVTGSCSDGDNNSVYIATAGLGGVFTMGARQDLGSPTGWIDFYAFAGDFNGDGKTDLMFNSTCQRKNYIDSTCTIGDANQVYTALSNGSGGFTLSPPQTYGASGWTDYPNAFDLTGDVNGDGRADLVWSSSSQTVAKTNNNLVVVGFANPDGTFQLGSIQDFGSDWTGRLTLADLNQDGKADLVWSTPARGDTDVNLYAAAISNGDGSFASLGPGALYSPQGSYSLPLTNILNRLPTGLTFISPLQASNSDALFIVNGAWKSGLAFMPFMHK